MPQPPQYGFEHQDLEVLHLVNKKAALERAKRDKLKSGLSNVEVKKKYQGDSKMKKLEEDMEKEAMMDRAKAMYSSAKARAGKMYAGGKRIAKGEELYNSTKEKHAGVVRE